jgi:hypothetical protein
MHRSTTADLKPPGDEGKINADEIAATCQKDAFKVWTQ